MRILYDDPIEQGIRDGLAKASPEDRAWAEKILTPAVIEAIKEVGWYMLEEVENPIPGANNARRNTS
jgi:hypothetical protein